MIGCWKLCSHPPASQRGERPRKKDRGTVTGAGVEDQTVFVELRESGKDLQQYNRIPSREEEKITEKRGT